LTGSRGPEPERGSGEDQERLDGALEHGLDEEHVAGRRWYEADAGLVGELRRENTY
jgi:hypothetical protein